MKMNIPFVDFRAQYLALQDEIERAMSAVVSDMAFVGGKFVAASERQFAEAYGVALCVSVEQRAFVEIV